MLGEWDRTSVSPDLLAQTEPLSEALVPSHLLHGCESEQLMFMFSLGHIEPPTGYSNEDIKKELVQNANFINVDINGTIYVFTCSFRCLFCICCACREALTQLLKAHREKYCIVKNQ